MLRVMGSGTKPCDGLTRREALRGHLAMLVFALVISGSFTFGGIIAPLVAGGDYCLRHQHQQPPQQEAGAEPAAAQ